MAGVDPGTSDQASTRRLATAGAASFAERQQRALGRGDQGGDAERVVLVGAAQKYLGLERRLRRGQDFTDPACRLSAGVATDEPLPRLRYGRRVYVFHPRPWTAAAAANILREVRSWR